MIDNLLLGLQMDLRGTAQCLEVQPIVEFLAGIERQHSKLQQKLGGAVADDPKTVYQFAVDVVIDLEFHRVVAQQDSAAAAKDFDKSLVFLWEYRVENRQEVSLVADAGNWGSDRFSRSILKRKWPVRFPWWGSRIGHCDYLPSFPKRNGTYP